eukprot:m.1041766 g.1041766  ORF g.1041766 m.1041766 type:complete len:215 (-) comp24161_c0_seq1:240-884(-)
MRGCIRRDVYNATTTMECWSPDELPNLSFSHIWSSSPNFIIPWFLAGIQATAPGWSEVSVKPQPGPLDSMSFSMPTIRGRLYVNTSVTRLAGPAPVSLSENAQGLGNRLTFVTNFKVTATIPGNMRARLHVPVPPDNRIDQHSTRGMEPVHPHCVQLDGQKTVGSLSPQGRHLAMVVGAGTHVLEWCFTEADATHSKIFDASATVNSARLHTTG